MKDDFITGTIFTPMGSIPQVSTRLTMKDYLGSVMVRWGMNRNRYRVNPGLYAIGTPNERSDVMVTANYKLTFDTVRKHLRGLNVWLLILDTKGINVWCAAGKGIFGTDELVRRIQLTSLDKIVKHRRLILPQHGAVGVAAHLVKQYSGFTVIYGPVRVSDIQAFLQAHYKTSREMRRVNFGFYDRLKLIPNDIIYDMRYLLPVLMGIFILSGINKFGFFFQQAFDFGLPVMKKIVLGYFAGIVLTPLLLPYIPSRAFAFKGFIVGTLLSIVLLFNHSLGNSILQMAAWFFLLSGVSSFLAMNFTGASTYTSLSGVKKEMKIAVPVQIASCSLAFILFMTEKLL